MDDLLLHSITSQYHLKIDEEQEFLDRCPDHWGQGGIYPVGPL
jgi:hypothetical protein